VTFFGKTLKLGPGTEVSRIRDFETCKKEDFLFKSFISNQKQTILFGILLLHNKRILGDTNLLSKIPTFGILAIR
jgi:hypothetical protein